MPTNVSSRAREALLAKVVTDTFGITMGDVAEMLKYIRLSVGPFKSRGSVADGTDSADPLINRGYRPPQDRPKEKQPDKKPPQSGAENHKPGQTPDGGVVDGGTPDQNPLDRLPTWEEILQEEKDRNKGPKGKSTDPDQSTGLYASEDSGAGTDPEPEIPEDPSGPIEPEESVAGFDPEGGFHAGRFSDLPKAVQDSLRRFGSGPASYDPEGTADPGNPKHPGLRPPRGPAGTPNPEGDGPVGPMIFPNGAIYIPAPDGGGPQGPALRRMLSCLIVLSLMRE
jgi:hypothetical protein